MTDKDINADFSLENEMERNNAPRSVELEGEVADLQQGEKAAPVEDFQDETLRITNRAIELLKTVYDPEIPVNVYDLGLIYKIDFDPEDRMLHVDMTLTAPGCPAADFILEDVRQKLLSVEGPKGVDLRLVFDPIWDQDMMSEEAKLELGFL